jgi:hypothetical protein
VAVAQHGAVQRPQTRHLHTTREERGSDKPGGGGWARRDQACQDESQAEPSPQVLVDPVDLASVCIVCASQSCRSDYCV